jgi:manganese/zinc/iron transport system permease protein
MMSGVVWTLQYDGLIMLAGVLCAVAASLPGNFLVLRRISLLGDAVSHAVLPGIAVGFLLTESRTGIPVFLGAVGAGLLTAVLTEWIRSVGAVDEGAATGVVFTILFAVGLILIVRTADRVDLDPGCVLYGSLEDSPLHTVSFAGFEVPRIVLILGGVVIVNLLFVGVLFKELMICSFDPGLATTEGFSARLLHYLLMVDVAITAVACFEAAGNILVVAMFIVPPATAMLLTTQLKRMIALSAGLAAMSAMMGDFGATFVTTWMGFGSTSTAGMMTLSAGLLFLAAALFSPQTGVLSRIFSRRRLGLRILQEDVLAFLYRMREQQQSGASTELLQTRLLASSVSLGLILRLQRWRGILESGRDGWVLTDRGIDVAASLVRSHRLWESYLVTGGISPDVIHRQAEKLEHYTGHSLQQRLDNQTDAADTDPHGRPIPRSTDQGEGEA